MQYDLFDPPKIARTTDPATSYAAAKDVDCAGLRRLFVEGVAHLGKATAKEVEQYWGGGSHGESIRKRASECVSKRLVRVISKARCRVTGKMAQIYEVCE